MKRFLSILLVAMLIVTSLATAAFAAGSATVSVSSIENAVPGNEYTVTFTVSGEFANYELYVKADSGLKLTGISGITGNVNTGKVAYATDENVGSHSFKATFKLSDTAKCGTYKVNAEVLFVSDRNLVEQNVTVTAGKIVVSHAWGEWKVKTPATCTASGEKTRTCAYCGEVESVAIPVVAHTPGAWEVTKPATCTEAGEKVQKCAVCQTVLKTEVIPAAGHKMVVVEKKDATCTENGYENQKCSVCGHPKNTTLYATGHVEGNWEVLKEATCTEAGQKQKKCTVCGEVLKTETIAAKGHDESGQWTVTKEPTCTEAGEKVLKCAVCNVVLKTESIPANGHKACCTDWMCDHDHYDNKNHWFVCSVCGVTFEVEEHTMVAFDGGKQCKCGYTVYDDAPEEPDTGDYRLEMVVAFASAIALMAAAAYVFKRKFAK